MQVKPERVADHLARGRLSPCYLVFGPEPLQARESGDAVRAAARAAGITERVVFDATGSPDWNTLRTSTASYSLFAERRLFEIRCGAKKPDKDGGECIAELVALPDPLDIYLITAETLDRQSQASAWFKACERYGAVIPCRDLEFTAFKHWLTARARQHDLTLSLDANEFIALRAEGNLLAAAQEIDKLALLLPNSTIDLNAAIVAVADTARYDVFQCVDAALEGNALRAVRMVRGLREEGTEAIVIAWSLNRELRTLTRVAAAHAAGHAVDTALAAQNVWSSRYGVVKRALQRQPLAHLAALLEASIRLDQLIKGSGFGSVWEEIENLVIALAGGPWLGRPA
ncbi:MAG: DNA polymerase III subunit delta [Gammaproteobacteria bacterium]